MYCLIPLHHCICVFLYFFAFLVWSNLLIGFLLLPAPLHDLCYILIIYQYTLFFFGLLQTCSSLFFCVRALETLRTEPRFISFFYSQPELATDLSPSRHFNHCNCGLWHQFIFFPCRFSCVIRVEDFETTSHNRIWPANISCQNTKFICFLFNDSILVSTI